jgi:hypothetical protein
MSRKSAETSRPIFREFHSPKELHWLTSIISALRTHALSGMRTSFIGQAMKSSYYACNLESGKGDHLFRTAIHITNGTIGTGSDNRRKQIINDKLAEESLFEGLMEKFRIRFRHLAINLQRSIKAAIEKNLDTVQRSLDIVKSENVASESEQEKDFRGRVEAKIKTAEEKIRQIHSSPPRNPAGGAEPPERRTTLQSRLKFDSLRRRRTDDSTASSKGGKEKGPFQEHFSCYAGLTWEVLRDYLLSKWPNIKLVERKV